ncbi:MAG: hypothetical protein MUF22_07445 [Chitinispirillaceae bacterium]|jgi:hypothetical protein|nr:hypothetical protein [Chitinispirillaceae bacterium]
MLLRFFRPVLYSLTPVLIILAIAGCTDAGSKPLGQAIPADAQIATLAEIKASPADFNHKKVVMKGIVSAQCPSLCEFTYKEGTQAAIVFPQGFKFPKLKTNRPVTLYAEITSGPENIVVSALGMRME